MKALLPVVALTLAGAALADDQPRAATTPATTPATTTPATTTPATTTPATTTPARTTTVDEGSGGGLLVGGGTLLGVGAVVVGGAVYFGLTASQTATSAAAAVFQDERAQLNNDAGSQALIANVLYGVGAAVAVGGLATLGVGLAGGGQ